MRKDDPYASDYSDQLQLDPEGALPQPGAQLGGTGASGGGPRKQSPRLGQLSQEDGSLPQPFWVGHRASRYRIGATV